MKPAQLCFVLLGLIAPTSAGAQEVVSAFGRKVTALGNTKQKFANYMDARDNELLIENGIFAELDVINSDLTTWVVAWQIDFNAIIAAVQADNLDTILGRIGELSARQAERLSSTNNRVAHLKVRIEAAVNKLRLTPSLEFEFIGNQTSYLRMTNYVQQLASSIESIPQDLDALTTFLNSEQGNLVDRKLQRIRKIFIEKNIANLEQAFTRADSALKEGALVGQISAKVINLYNSFNE